VIVSRRLSRRATSVLARVESAHKKSREAKLVKLADKTSNLRAVTLSPAPDWSVKRRLEYIEWSKSVVAGLRGTSPWLEEQFDEAAKQAEQSMHPPRFVRPADGER